jgi:hypothetical protein
MVDYVIDLAKDVAPALALVFGTTFICDTPAIAQAVCFDKRVWARCVTLDGDVYDPRGTMEGGSSGEGRDAPEAAEAASAKGRSWVALNLLAFLFLSMSTRKTPASGATDSTTPRSVVPTTSTR